MSKRENKHRKKTEYPLVVTRKWNSGPNWWSLKTFIESGSVWRISDDKQAYTKVPDSFLLLGGNYSSGAFINENFDYFWYQPANKPNPNCFSVNAKIPYCCMGCQCWAGCTKKYGY